MAEDQSEFLKGLPENIGDIDNEDDLIRVLGDMYECDDTFSIHKGFIYMYNNYSFEDTISENLFTISFDDIQHIYQYYKRGLSNRYKLRFQETKICGHDYLMFGGKFTIVSLGGLYEENDLIFYTKDNNYIALTEKYYSLPDYIKKGSVKPYTPIKSNFKFNKCMRAYGQKFFIVDKHYRHVVDPYDTRVSFMCADTFDIVNPETGERVKTWKTTIICKGLWETIKPAIDNVNCALPDNDISGTRSVLVFSEQWNQYYLIVSDKNVYELRYNNSGLATKAATSAGGRD
jgi:hypothetical protein